MGEEDPDREGGPSPLVAGAVSVGILLVMGGIHVFMTYGGANAISTPANEGPVQPPRPGSDRSCTVTSKPRGAKIVEVADEGPIALGVTPTEIEQGEYTIRLELEHHQAAEAKVGIHEGKCEIHRNLLMAEDSP